MRRTLIIVVGLAWMVAVGAPSPEAAPIDAGRERAWTHTRPLTPSAADLVSYAAARAPAVCALLETLEQSDVVVYVTDEMSGLTNEPSAYLRFVSRAAGLRYLLVQVARWDVSPTDRVAWLAHELQHAVEIARAPDVQDNASVARLYRQIGWQSGRGRFETSEARWVGRLARFQLGERPR